MERSLLRLLEQVFSQPVPPDRVFEHPEAREIRARVREVVERRGGLVTVTGVPGLGKTTLLQWVLATIPARNRVLSLPFPIAGEQLLVRVAGILGLPPAGTPSSPVPLKAVRSALAAHRETGGCVIVAIDQAHRMPDETLIMLGLLMAPVSDPDPLMPVILVAQPDLERQLARLRKAGAVLPAAVSCRLGPLSAAQVRAYVDERVRWAGGDPASLFEPEALRRLVANTSGIPRLINTICLEALRVVAATGQPRISGAVINQVARPFEPSETARGSMAWAQATLGAGRLPVARVRPTLGAWRLPAAWLRATLGAWRLRVARVRPILGAWRLPVARLRAMLGAWRFPVAWLRAILGAWRLPVAWLRAMLGAWRLPVAWLRAILGAWRLPVAWLRAMLSAWRLRVARVRPILGAWHLPVAWLRATLGAWRLRVARARPILDAWHLPVAWLRAMLGAWRLPVARTRETLSAWRPSPRVVRRRLSAGIAVAVAVVTLIPVGIVLFQHNARSRLPTAGPTVPLDVRSLSQPEGAGGARPPGSTAALSPWPSDRVDPSVGGARAPEPAGSRAERPDARPRRSRAQAGGSVIREAREAPPSASERALLKAAEEGNAPALKTLLRAATPAGTRDADGFTPLMLATIQGHVAAAHVLLDHGARINDRSARGLSPLMLAIMNRHTAIVRLFLDRGADVNARDRLGWTPLIHAAWTGDPEVVRLLLRRGVDRRAADHRGWTADHYARWRLTHPATGVDETLAVTDRTPSPGDPPIRSPHAEITALLNAPSPGLPVSPIRAAQTARPGGHR